MERRETPQQLNRPTELRKGDVIVLRWWQRRQGNDHVSVEKRAVIELREDVERAQQHVYPATDYHPAATWYAVKVKGIALCDGLELSEFHVNSSEFSVRLLDRVYAISDVLGPRHVRLPRFR